MEEELSFNCDWENGIIRQAIIELGDKEALRLFDEEQERMKAAAEKEIEEMRKQGRTATYRTAPRARAARVLSASRACSIRA